MSNPAKRRLAPARLGALSLAIALLGAGIAVASPTAAPKAPTNVPLHGSVFFGVTDTGVQDDFHAFAKAIGKHPAVVESYRAFGTSVRYELHRWESMHARPLLHVSTAQGDKGLEVISPKGIARGLGDDYLLRVNHFFHSRRMPAYIRPLGEPNRCLNPYTAVRCNGSSNGGDHSTYWYRQAFRRMYLVFHGGSTTKAIDHKLKKLRMPPVNRQAGKGREPTAIPKAPVSVIWSPQAVGSPDVPGNGPADYFPGLRYVDWVGTDMYSRYTDFGALNGFYETYAKHKPFAITEFGIWGKDDPAYMRDMLSWAHSHRQVRMLVYYQDFGDHNQFKIQGFPRSKAVLKKALNAKRFPSLAPRYPKPAPQQG